MRKGRGTKEASDIGGGVKGEHGEGLLGIWEAAGECVGFQVPGTGDDGGRQQLASSGRQPVKGAEELGAFVVDTMPGGGGREGVGKLFQGGGTGGVAVRGGDVGTYPEDGTGPGLLPARGRAPAHREINAEKGGQALGVSSFGGGHDRGRV